MDDKTYDEIYSEIGEIEAEGFIYLQDWQDVPYIPDRVQLPDGRIVDESELADLINLNPFSDILIRAQKLFDLYFTEGMEDLRFMSISFLDEEDERKAKEKYSKSF